MSSKRSVTRPSKRSSESVSKKKGPYIMPINLTGRSFLTLKDFSPSEIRFLLDLSRDYKAMKRAGIYPKRLQNKNIALIFEKPSTRTRCAFTTACHDEGAHPEYLGKNDIQMGKKESIPDT